MNESCRPVRRSGAGWNSSPRKVEVGVAAWALLAVLAAACGPPAQVAPPQEAGPAPAADGADAGPPAARLEEAAPGVDPSIIPGVEAWSRPSPPPLGATPARDAAPPTVDALAPYFTDSPLREALAAYQRADNAAAAAAFEAFAATAAPADPRRRPAELLALLARRDAGEHTPTATALEGLAASWPDLNDHLHYHAATAHLDAGRWAEAATVADRIPQGSTLWGRAREVRARAQWSAGRGAEAAATLDEAAARDGQALRSTAWALRGRIAATREGQPAATRYLLEQAIRFPTTSEGRAALKALGRKPKLSARDRLRLGDALHRAQRHDAALSVLGGLAPDDPGCREARGTKGRGPTDDARVTCGWCRGRYLAARTLEKKKQASAAWAAFEDALSCTADLGVRADATFAAGRNRAKAGDRATAERLLGEHVERFADRTTVDDALVLLAGLAREGGDPAAADALLMRIVEQHPGGDQVDQAAWDLVWPRIADGRYAEALAFADQVLAVAPRETHYRAEGRVRYWRGRLLLHLGRDEEARTDFVRVLAEHPLSWYALLSYARLVAHDPEAAREQLAAMVAASSPPPDPLAQIPARLWAEDHFRRGVELHRLGLTSAAQREFDAVPDHPVAPPTADTGAPPASEEGGEERPGGTPAPTREGQEEPSAEAPPHSEAAAAPPVGTQATPPAADEGAAWLWTRVALLHEARAWHLGMRLARPEEPVFGQFWPTSRNSRVWSLAHPQAFSELVERWADARAIPSAWVYAIAREESGFNPTIESWANAVGLMQIIMPTAEMLAKGTDIKPTRAALQDPAVALELGTKYLAKLLREHGVIPLASAGYNAGSGSVRRWRRAFGDRELDEFVERITYDEARGYAQRVTRSVARYLWLYEGRMLVLPLDPPGAPE